MFILGIAYGSLMGDLEGFLGISELVQKMIPTAEGLSLTQSYVTMLMTIISVLGTIPVVMLVQKLNSEEKKNRISPLLTTAVSRNSLIGFGFREYNRRDIE